MTYKTLTIALLCAMVQFSQVPLATAADSCAVVAQKLQEQSKGRILNVKEEMQDGVVICAVDILVPGKNGNPPRKKSFKVPQ